MNIIARIPQTEELFVNPNTYKINPKQLSGYLPLTYSSVSEIESLTTGICNSVLPDKQPSLLQKISKILTGQAFHNPYDISNTYLEAFSRTAISVIEPLNTLICNKSPPDKQQILLREISKILTRQAFHNPYDISDTYLKAFSRTAISILREIENPPLALMKKIKDNFIMVAVNKKKAETLQLAKQAEIPISESMFPFIDAKSILSYLKAFELDESIVLRSTKDSIFINTFKNYCASHEDSFLNKVCLAALERKLTSTPEPEKNKKDVIYKALVDVLGEYLGDTCDYTGLTLREMLLQIEKLETSFHDDFKESYGIFFSKALKAQTVRHRLEKRSKEELTDINILANVISEFHNPSNRDALNSILHLNLQDFEARNLCIVPLELKVLTNLKGLYLSNAQITTLPDLSQNTELLHLDLRNTQITTPPDLSQNTKLRDLDLRNTQTTVDQQQSIRALLPLCRCKF